MFGRAARTRCAAAGALLLALGLGSCGEPERQAAPPSAAPPTVVVGVPAVPRSIDPVRARSRTERMVAAATQTPLLTYDRRREETAARLVPALAAALPTLSPDLLEYRFQLRTGLLYADGRLVKASDVERAVAEASRSAAPGLRSALSSIVGAPATGETLRGVRSDDRTGMVVVRLRRPDGRLPFALADPATAPTPELPRRGTAAATGPLRVVQQAVGRVELAANPLRPTVSSVPAAAVARVVLVSGSAAERADLTLAPATVASDDDALVAAPTLATTTAYVRPAGPLARRAVRLALARAVDRRSGDAEAALCTLLPAVVAGGESRSPCPAPPSIEGDVLAGVTLRVAVRQPSPGADRLRDAIRRLGGRADLIRTPAPRSILSTADAEIAVDAITPELPHPAAWLRLMQPLDPLLAREVPRRSRQPVTGAAARWAALEARARDRGVAIPLEAGVQRVRIEGRIEPRSVALHPILGLDLAALRLTGARPTQ